MWRRSGFSFQLVPTRTYKMRTSRLSTHLQCYIIRTLTQLCVEQQRTPCPSNHVLWDQCHIPFKIQIPSTREMVSSVVGFTSKIAPITTSQSTLHPHQSIWRFREFRESPTVSSIKVNVREIKEESLIEARKITNLFRRTILCRSLPTSWSWPTQTPVTLAAERGLHGVVKVLAEHDGTDINLQDSFGRTPLHW